MVPPDYTEGRGARRPVDVCSAPTEAERRLPYADNGTVYSDHCLVRDLLRNRTRDWFSHKKITAQASKLKRLF